MILQGHIHNAVVILEHSPPLPERAAVLERADQDNQVRTRRQGGQYVGQIWMASDFDQWPDDMQEALGMTP